MPWVKGSLTRGQYNLIIALLILEKEETSEPDKDPFFEKKLEEARNKASMKKKDLESRIYNSTDKNSVIEESQNILSEKLNLNNK